MPNQDAGRVSKNQSGCHASLGQSRTWQTVLAPSPTGPPEIHGRGTLAASSRPPGHPHQFELGHNIFQVLVGGNSAHTCGGHAHSFEDDASKCRTWQVSSTWLNTSGYGKQAEQPRKCLELNQGPSSSYTTSSRQMRPHGFDPGARLQNHTGHQGHPNLNTNACANMR